MAHLTKFSFGATSAIVTSLALIVGLSRSANPRLAIIGSLLIIAIADTISDSLGIHIYQESALLNAKTVRAGTFLNFLTRFLVMLIFILFFAFLPLRHAVVFSLVYGIFVLSVLSYLIAREQKVNPCLAILYHVAIAILVIIASGLLSQWLFEIFRKT